MAQLHIKPDFIIGHFQAMASPCEVLLDTQDSRQAEKLVDIAEKEARRIEEKFSRYRDDNIVATINRANGQTVRVDQETARLLDYAAQCYQLSGGKFDITSGVLRKVWNFDGSDKLPPPSQVEIVLQLVGWEKIHWQASEIRLPKGMQIDLGGIGKEYAVDRIAQLLQQACSLSFVVNLGGDIFVSGPRADGQSWQIALDDPAASGEQSIGTIRIQRGGIATSGDARRYLLKNGKRYSHILNPKTGWPVEDAPHSVTVVADSCIEAGMLATFAMLEGENAKAFLEAQHVPYWLA